MKKGFYRLLPALVVALAALHENVAAQELPEQEHSGIALSEEAVVLPAAVLDSTLIGRNIVDIVNSAGGVGINQSASVNNALVGHTAVTEKRKLSGYRIRIFFSNRQSARAESEKIQNEFKETFPGIPVYRTYPSPHFKVAVGDYRTRTDAFRDLETIKIFFQDAYIVKEREINYPRLRMTL